VNDEWCRRTGLPADCQVLCGLHDSNAALLAARQYPEIGGRECTVISTGTWFVAMHSVASGTTCDLSRLSEKRDCLVNVDAFGVPVPSARFMGGRETELIEQAEGTMLDPTEHKDELIRLAARAVAEDIYVLPAVQRGVGPYPDNAGGWSNRPENETARRAVAGLYLALMTDALLALLGARGTLAIEGRFAGDPVFTGALAALRPDRPVYLLPVLDNLSLGALHLVAPCPPHEKPTKVEPLAVDLADYAGRWRERAERGRRDL
jgi:sugar (pentulose or hexulose) kinase